MEPAVIFCIPLIARAMVADWAVIEANLARTLGTVLRQSDGRWRAVVCGHDLPRLPADPRIVGIAIDRPLDGDDKWAKIREILRQDPDTDALLFPLDADDLLHPDLVAVMARETADGWILHDGWSLDASTGTLGRHGQPTQAHPRRAPLYRACGSSGAVRMVKGDIRATHQLLVQHWALPAAAARLGRSLRPLPFPGAAYLVAHGENQETRSGREADKLRYIAANPVGPAEDAAARRLLQLPDGPLSAAA